MSDGPAYVSSGIEGLDLLLRGGYPRDRIMLVEGEPGTGKTTLALQFLVAGVSRGLRALFLSVAQSEQELKSIAESHGLSLAGVEVVTPDLGDGISRQSFSVDTSEAQLVELMNTVYEKLDEVKPDLFVFDSLLELRLLTSGEVAYRRETLHLRHHLRERGTTSLLLDHLQPEGRERHAEGIAHGVIRLQAQTPPIGIIHRKLNIMKLRGVAYLEGVHDFRIRTGGLEVFPRVVPTESRYGEIMEPMATGRQTLDDMLGGGLEFGTTTLIAGQSGTGKSTIATLFADAAAAQGIKPAMFLFEERPEVFRRRSTGLGLKIADFEDEGKLSLRHFDPAEIAPGEFARTVIAAVENEGARVVVIDSITGYLNALPDREAVVTHLHTLLQYLSRCGALVIVTMAQHGLLGETPRSDLDTSYLADSIILLRHYAAGSAIRRSVTVLKKRHGPHDRQLQELLIGSNQVDVVPISEVTALGMQGFAQVGGG